MQVLNLELTFGQNEANVENRILEINIDDKCPLQFSIINADYEISSFEQNLNVKLKLKNLKSRETDPVYTYRNTTFKYIVNLYLKFPLNTFDKSDEVVDLTFEEYNTATNNSNIKFVSPSQIKENKEEKVLSDKIFIVVISIIGLHRH